jgi:hypothetical protein
MAPSSARRVSPRCSSPMPKKGNSTFSLARTFPASGGISSPPEPAQRYSTPFSFSSRSAAGVGMARTFDTTRHRSTPRLRYQSWSSSARPPRRRAQAGGVTGSPDTLQAHNHGALTELVVPIKAISAKSAPQGPVADIALDTPVGGNAATNGKSANRHKRPGRDHVFARHLVASNDEACYRRGRASKAIAPDRRTAPGPVKWAGGV